MSHRTPVREMAQPMFSDGLEKNLIDATTCGSCFGGFSGFLVGGVLGVAVGGVVGADSDSGGGVRGSFGRPGRSGDSALTRSDAVPHAPRDRHSTAPRHGPSARSLIRLPPDVPEVRDTILARGLTARPSGGILSPSRSFRTHRRNRSLSVTMILTDSSDSGEPVAWVSGWP